MPTKKQVNALKYLIFLSRDGTDLSKRVLAFLIDQSEQLTKEVCLSLVADREGYTADEIVAAGHGVGGMQSQNSTTHLVQLLMLMGSVLRTSVHYGDYDPSRTGDPFNNDGQFAGWSAAQASKPGLVLEGLPMRYTFWFSKDQYSREAMLVVATREELEKINLKKPGLYPSLESN